MNLPLYLALTPTELEQVSPAPAKTAWMSCHFSSCGPGLTDIPSELPSDSLLILDDSTPVQGHDPHQILWELEAAVQKLRPAGLVLDLERPDNARTDAIADTLCKASPCPVYVSQNYAHQEERNVFLSAPPLHVPLAQALAPWKNRKVLLEAVPQAQKMILTREGCQILPCDLQEESFPFWESSLHCTYKIETNEEQAVFTLQRTAAHLSSFLQEAQDLGVQGALGLYQELKNADSLSAVCI